MKILLKTLNDLNVTTQSNGDMFNELSGAIWMSLNDKNELLHIAKMLSNFNVRVCMITCYLKNKSHEIIYHFDIDGVIVNIKVITHNQHIASITPFYKSADWAERELSELYGIVVEGHPNPQRLFLDESIKEGVLNNYISLSSAMNGKITQELWKHVHAKDIL